MIQQTSMIDVRAIWDELAREQGQRTALHRLHDVRSVKFFLGYIPQTGIRFVQLDLPASVAKRTASIRRTQAIQLERVPLNAEEHTLILLLQEPGLTDVFSFFIDDLLQHLVLTQDAEQAAITLYMRFEHWQQLFAKLSSDLIALEVQRGLYGELTLLKHLLDRHKDDPSIWECWRGPFSANHDFSKNGIALEVKCSVASSPVMHISNELQLDLTGWKFLVLCLVHLSENRGGSNTLSTLIHELLDRSEQQPSIHLAFRSKLLKVGVDQRHYEQFSDLGYAVRTIDCYHVTEGFPSIRRSSLDNAITKVNYELLPAGCENHRIEFFSALDLFQ